MKLRSLVALALGLVWLNVGMAQGFSQAHPSDQVAQTPLNPAHHPHHPWKPHHPWNPQYPHYPPYGYGYGNFCSTWGGVCPIVPAGPIGYSCWCAFWNGTFWGQVIR